MRQTTSMKIINIFSTLAVNDMCFAEQAGKVGNDQEKAQYERHSHSKNRGGKKQIDKAFTQITQRGIFFFQGPRSSIFSYLKSITLINVEMPISTFISRIN